MRNETQLNIGGQAVIEGVMMKTPDKAAVAVRNVKTNNVVVSAIDLPFNLKKPFFKFYFIRGIAALIEALYVGVKSLTLSAQLSAQNEDEEITKKEMVLTVIAAFALAIFLFIVTPLFFTELIKKNIELTPVLYNLIDGVFRLIIFMAYIIAIGFIPDIKRIFEYHGAEHKTVNAFEKGEELKVDNIKKYSAFHPRCGTSFLLFVVFVSIFLFTLVIRSPSVSNRLIMRIILLPFVAGISYELLKLSFKFKDNPLMKLISYPGIAVQSLTTKEPSDDQIEVAIEALKACVIQGK